MWFGGLKMWWVVFGLLAACKTGSGRALDDSGLDDPDGDPDQVDLAGTCDLADRYGAFSVGAYVDEGYTIVDGSVADGVVPVTILEQTSREGDCRLMKRNNPFCDPGCDPDETCDFDGSCIPYPTDQDLGRVTIAGLAAAVSMDPVTPGYTYFDTSLPHPGFEAGKLIELKTGGGAYDPITLHGVGVGLLEPGEPEWFLQAGTPLAVTWNPPSGAVRSTVYLEINVDQHGASPVNLWCDFADDGDATVPASVVDGLLDAGVTGFPQASLIRRTVDSADVGEGCMEFIVSSPRSVDVDVDGYTSCYDDDDCPDGQTCNEALQICE